MDGVSDLLVIDLDNGLEPHLVHKEIPVPHADILPLFSNSTSSFLNRGSGATPVVKVRIVLKRSKGAQVVIFL